MCDQRQKEAMISFMKELTGGEHIDYDSSEVERNLRELLHSIMSLPEFQLG